MPEAPAGRPRAPQGELLQGLRAAGQGPRSGCSATSRPAFWFLFASAIYRDGLAGIFAFAGVLATAAFGFGANEVIIFAIVANVVAGVSTIFAGRADDRFGPKAVIVFALTGLVAMAVVVFVLHDLGSIVFWVGGLILASFVGPAQAASRSLLARVTPVGLQGEIFGLYATTGRVASFISPGAVDAGHRDLGLDDLRRPGHRARAARRPRAAAARQAARPAGPGRFRRLAELPGALD